jgi:hypothetical protein
MKRAKKYTIYKFAASFEVLTNIFIEEEGPLLLEIRIFHVGSLSNVYRATVARMERFRIQSTSPQSEGIPTHAPSDEALWVQDNFLWDSEKRIQVGDVESALNTVLKAIEKITSR